MSHEMLWVRSCAILVLLQTKELQMSVSEQNSRTFSEKNTGIHFSKTTRYLTNCQYPCQRQTLLEKIESVRASEVHQDVYTQDAHDATGAPEGKVC